MATRALGRIDRFNDVFLTGRATIEREIKDELQVP